MPKPRPAALGAVLRFFRFAMGWTEEDLARALGVTKVLISHYEWGTRKQLSRERLEELLAVMGVPSEAIDAALYALGLALPPEAPSSPVDPSPAQRRILHQAAAVAGLKAAEAIRERLTGNLRRLHADRARRHAGKLWKKLAKLDDPKRQRLAVERESRYWTWSLAELVCHESARAAAHRADRAVELASLALRIAELALVGETFRSRLKGYVWGFVANARRVLGELPGAEEAFLHSDRLWEAGAAADPGLLDGSRLLDLKASLRSYQGRFQEALVLLDQALEASRSEETRGRILIKKATNLELMGEYEQAIATVRQAELLIEGTRSPRLPFLVQFTLASNLKELARYADAEALLPEVKRLAKGLGNELDLVRSKWLEGLVWAGLRRREEALAALEQVRRYFSVNQIAYDAALATLDVAVLDLERGRTGEVKRLAARILWIFEKQEVHQEALASLRLFCEAARKEEATAKLARRVAEYLRKAQHDPELRFEAE